MTFGVGEGKIWWGEGVGRRGGPNGGGMHKFLAGVEDSPPSPNEDPPIHPVEKTLYVPTANCMCYSHDHKPLIMYQSIYYQK